MQVGLLHLTSLLPTDTTVLGTTKHMQDWGRSPSLVVVTYSEQALGVESLLQVSRPSSQWAHISFSLSLSLKTKEDVARADRAAWIKAQEETL